MKLPTDCEQSLNGVSIDKWRQLWLSGSALSVAQHQLTNVDIIEGMMRAQFGNRSDSEFVESFMKKYFEDWKSYKNRFTHLEWYHIFLECVEKFQEYQNKNKP